MVTTQLISNKYLQCFLRGTVLVRSTSKARLFGTLLLLMFTCHAIAGCKSKRVSGSSLASDTDQSLDHEVLRKNLEAILAKDSPCTGREPTNNPKQIRLLTSDEYNQTIRSIFQTYFDAYSLLPVHYKILGFSNIAAYNIVSAEHASAYHKVAAKLADHLVTNEWSKLVSCQPVAGRSCAEEFIEKFGLKIWRRPLTNEDFSSLLKLYEAGAGKSPPDGMKLMLRGMLNSSNFLYRSEICENGLLTPFERASALSYFFWGTAPDDQLLQLAQDAQLLDDKVLLSEAKRLMADERAKRGTRHLAEAWLNYSDVLNVNKDRELFPSFDAIRQALAQETEIVFDDLVRKRRADFRELFAGQSSLGDRALADFYQGLAAGGKLTFPDQPRVGLLGHASLLASLAYAGETSPIKRGKFIRERILCDILMPPPADLKIKIPDRDPKQTTRERFSAHSSVEPCRSCHLKIDGIGFAMEDFDAIGRYRKTDNGKPVDASGEIIGLDGRDIPVNGSRELSLALADSERAQKCFVIHTWRLAQGRIENDGDVCALRTLTAEVVQKKLSLADILLRIITDPRYSDRAD